MIHLHDFLNDFDTFFPEQRHRQAWDITRELPALLSSSQSALGTDYTITDGIAVHHTATIEQGVVFKGPVIIGPHCFIGAHAYLRGGVFLGEGCKIGPGCEIKSSVILNHSATAHFNFVGDSVIGSDVNLEAGAVIANHYNEREDKRIVVSHDNRLLPTGTEKIGALIGDGSRIGANAVLSPGTILGKNSIVKRLELVDQNN